MRNCKKCVVYVCMDAFIRTCVIYPIYISMYSLCTVWMHVCYWKCLLVIGYNVMWYVQANSYNACTYVRTYMVQTNKKKFGSDSQGNGKESIRSWQKPWLKLPVVHLAIATKIPSMLCMAFKYTFKCTRCIIHSICIYSHTYVHMYCILLHARSEQEQGDHGDSARGWWLSVSHSWLCWALWDAGRHERQGTNRSAHLPPLWESCLCYAVFWLATLSQSN